jgi:steroid Delta-isomerase
MATRDEICAVCDQYIALLSKGDVDAIVDLYDAGARVEDPLGTPPKNGHEEIRGFYAGVSGVSLTATRLGPVTVVGHEAAFQFRVDVPVGEDTISMVTTDLMTFNEAGKVVSMKAYADMDAKPGT